MANQLKMAMVNAAYLLQVLILVAKIAPLPQLDLHDRLLE